MRARDRLPAPEMARPTNRQSIERDIHDHEVFLSFVNDDDAYLFDEWWDTIGWALFKDWAKDKEAWQQ